jgi:DNA polymerase-3 subunit delta'
MVQDIITGLIPYPWQVNQWSRLWRQRQQDRLPHALLLFGQPGLGLDHFASSITQSILCQGIDDRGYACGSCMACRQYYQGIHPNFMRISMLEDKTVIVVDQVRELAGFLGLTGAGGGTKAIIISPADSMNLNAANSLLKTLEEPTGNTLIVLVVHHLKRLPATIKSRCQILGFTKPDKPAGLDWLESRGHKEAARLLQLAQGAPCLAESFDNEEAYPRYQAVIEGILGLLSGKATAFQLRKNWGTCAVGELVFWSLGLLRDCIRMVSGLPVAYFENSLYFKPLRNLAVLLDFPPLFRAYDHLVQLGEVLEHPLNKDLMIDDVILVWQSIRSRTGSHYGIRTRNSLAGH